MSRLVLAAALLIAAAPQSASQRYAVDDFTRISVHGPYAVAVTTGIPAGAVAEGSARAVSAVELKVDGGTLTVRPRAGSPGGDEPVRFRISTRTLASASLYGGGSLAVDRMAGADVRVQLNGDGDLSVGSIAADRVSAMATGEGRLALAGRATRALVGAVGAPRVDGDALAVRDLTLNSQGPAVVAVRATGTARVIATGPASIRVRGGATCTVRGDATDVACDR